MRALAFLGSLCPLGHGTRGTLGPLAALGLVAPAFFLPDSPPFLAAFLDRAKAAASAPSSLSLLLLLESSLLLLSLLLLVLLAAFLCSCCFFFFFFLDLASAAAAAAAADASESRPSSPLLPELALEGNSSSEAIGAGGVVPVLRLVDSKTGSVRSGGRSVGRSSPSRIGRSFDRDARRRRSQKAKTGGWENMPGTGHHRPFNHDPNFHI